MGTLQPTSPPFDDIILGSFVYVRPMRDALGVGAPEGHGSELLVQHCDDHGTALAAPSGRDDVLGSCTVIMLQLPRGAIHSILSGSDCTDCVMTTSTMSKFSRMTLPRDSTFSAGKWFGS